MGKRDKLSSNPVESARKAARAKELKKNKENRSKSKEFSLVKKDTRSLEQEIRSCSDPARVEGLRAELRRVREAKDKYLLDHPEHRKFIYPHQDQDNQKNEQQQQQKESLFRPDGKPTHPERSIYYDPVFNPWGNPPPGMPYVEKPAHLWASTSQPPIPIQQPDLENDEDDDDDGDDDEIMMPSGPPPPQAHKVDSDSDSEGSDDDIVMPAGPPPGTTPPIHYTGPPPTQYTRPTHYSGPPPPMMIPGQNGLPQRPPPPPQGYHPRPPPLPSNQQYQSRPPSHQGYPPRPRAPPNAPKGPSSQRPATAKPQSAGKATISSAPQLRNLKKEAVTFLPPSIRKQKALAKGKAKMAGLGEKGVVANPHVDDDGDLLQESKEESSHSQEPVSPIPPKAAVQAAPPIATTSRPKSSLVSYYDESDQSDDDEQEDEQPDPPSNTNARTERVNLVEALKMNLPPPRSTAQSKKDQGGGEYQNYLDSVGDLL